MKIHFAWAVILSLVAGLGGGFAGFKIAETSGSAENEESGPRSAPEIVAVTPAPKETTPKAEAPTLTDEDIENLIAEVDDGIDGPPVDLDRLAEMEARRQRWANMDIDQRRMLRKSFFSALSEIDGLEEIQEAAEQGRIDPRKFQIDPESIADRMEFYADTMDQAAMKTEVTKTLQSIVDQASAQMKGN